MNKAVEKVVEAVNADPLLGGLLVSSQPEVQISETDRSLLLRSSAGIFVGTIAAIVINCFYF